MRVEMTRKKLTSKQMKIITQKLMEWSSTKKKKAMVIVMRAHGLSFSDA